MSTIDPGQIDTTRPPDGSGDPNSPVNYTSAEERGHRTDIQGQFQAAKDDIEPLEAHAADTNNPHGVTAAQAGADPTGTASAAVSAHESAFAHANLPTADQKAAMDGANTPSAGNPFATSADIGAAGEANDGRNLGGGIPLFLQKNGVFLEYATLVSGDNSIIWSTSGNTVDGRATLPTGAGTVRVARVDSGPDFGDGRPRWNFIAGPNITIDGADDAGAGEATFTISAATPTGEANTLVTAAIVGANEARLELPKVGVELRHRKISGDSMVGVGEGTDAVNFSLLDASITNAKLAVQPAPATHVGTGGAEHAVATTSANGFMSAADKQKSEGIETGAQVNTVASVHGRIGAVVAAAGDYNASQITNALGTNVAATLDADVGVALTTRSVTGGGVFVPNPLQGQSVTLGAGNWTVSVMSVNGVVSIEVPQATGTVDVTGWTEVKGSRDDTRSNILDCRRTGSTAIATWV